MFHLSFGQNLFFLSQRSLPVGSDFPIMGMSFHFGSDFFVVVVVDWVLFLENHIYSCTIYILYVGSFP